VEVMIVKVDLLSLNINPASACSILELFKLKVFKWTSLMRYFGFKGSAAIKSSEKGNGKNSNEIYLFLLKK
jgi:hypothetical protein